MFSTFNACRYIGRIRLQSNFGVKKSDILKTFVLKIFCARDLTCAFYFHFLVRCCLVAFQIKFGANASNILEVILDKKWADDTDRRQRTTDTTERKNISKKLWFWILQPSKRIAISFCQLQCCNFSFLNINKAVMMKLKKLCLIFFF